MFRIDLPHDITARLRDHLSMLRPVEPAIEPLLAQLLQATSLLPTKIVQNLLEYRADPHAPAAFFLTGLPVDLDLPETPHDQAGPPFKSGDISERAILLIAILLGEPIAYLAEKHGVLVQNIFPVRSQQNTPSNESSAAPLGFHSELVYSPTAPGEPYHFAAPDFVLLLGLRCPADRSAATIFVEAKDICSRLSESDLAHLREPNFRLMAPYSFTRGGDGSRPLSIAVPILRGPPDSPSLAFDSACGIQALTDEADHALTALVQACDDPNLQQEVRIGPGDLLVLNNNRCVHARSTFIARFDGQDRWLQRVYVRQRIWPLPNASVESFRVLV